MAEAALKIDVTPKGLTYDLDGKQKFVLDSVDRLNLQRYLLQGMTLPTDNDALKRAFYLQDGMLNNFKDLLKAFQDIENHCKTFYDGAYTASVQLSSHIVDFDLDAKHYLKGIVSIADDYEHGRITADKAEESVTALINILTKNFDSFINDCNNVCDGINTFLKQTYSDNVVLNGQDGNSGLKKTYTDKYNLNQSRIKELQDKICALQKDLDRATKAYNYDVTVASTTPTYVWIFPFGTIPAAVVAGVYGDRARKAYKGIEDIRREIEDATGELNQKMAMVAGFATSSDCVTNIAGLIKSAITPIEKIKGTWFTLKDELQALDKTVKGDITTLPMCVKSMAVDKAVEEWDKVAKDADQYRRTAFITQVSSVEAATNTIQFPVHKDA